MIAVLLGVALAADPVVDALERELDRAGSQLALPDAPGPWFVGYQLMESDFATYTAAYGGVVSTWRGPWRTLGVAVRVGSADQDNSRFGQQWGSRGFGRTTLGVEPAAGETAREAWLLADTQYKAAVEALARKQAARRNHTDDTRPPDFALGAAEVYSEAGATLAEGDADALLSRCRAVSAPMLDHPLLPWSEASCGARAGRYVVLDTGGTRVQTAVRSASVQLMASVRADDGAMAWDQERWVAHAVSGLPDDDALRQGAAEVAARLEAWTQAQPAEEEYAGPVLFRGAAARDLFAWLLLPDLIGTPGPEIVDFRGEVTDPPPPPLRLNRRVLPQGWSVVDDPQADPSLPTSRTHDDEGMPARRVELVEDGLLRDQLMCRVPNEQRAGTNGHAIEAMGQEPSTGPTQVTIRPGHEVGERKLLKAAFALAADYGLDHVLEVRRLTDPEVTGKGDPDMFGSMFRMGYEQEGIALPPPLVVVRRYADGREVPVRGLAFAGADLRSLRDVVAAGASSTGTLAAPLRYPDARGEPDRVPVTITAPDVLIEELVLQPDRGKQHELPRTPSPLEGGDGPGQPR